MLEKLFSLLAWPFDFKVTVLVIGNLRFTLNIRDEILKA